MASNRYRFDFALSFSGSDRAIARELRTKLAKAGFSVFFDEDYEHEMIAEDGSMYLRNVYARDSRCCVVLISRGYDRGDWTNLERESIQSRELRGERGVLVPVLTDGHRPSWLPETRIFFNLAVRDLGQLTEVLSARLQSTGTVAGISKAQDPIPLSSAARDKLIEIPSDYVGAGFLIDGWIFHRTQELTRIEARELDVASNRLPVFFNSIQIDENWARYRSVRDPILLTDRQTRPDVIAIQSDLPDNLNLLGTKPKYRILARFAGKIDSKRSSGVRLGLYFWLVALVRLPEQELSEN